MTPEPRHPVEPWALVEEGVDIDRLAQAESLFALSNGHIGLRGNLDEGEPRRHERHLPERLLRVASRSSTASAATASPRTASRSST